MRFLVVSVSEHPTHPCLMALRVATLLSEVEATRNCLAAFSNTPHRGACVEHRESSLSKMIKQTKLGSDMAGDVAAALQTSGPPLESRDRLLATTTEQMANQVGEGASFRKGLQDYESMVHFSTMHLGEGA